MIAHICMYDREEIQEANDVFWSRIRKNLGYGPNTIARNIEHWDAWLSADLLLGHTCGFPFRAKLHNKVKLVGTPDYGLPGCPPGYYYSVLIARKNDGRQGLRAFDCARFAYNDPLSQSGWAAPVKHLGDLGIQLGIKIMSGGHRNSALYVLEGKADFAAIDAVTWEMIKRYDRWASDLRVIGITAPTPALPLITAPQNDADEIFDAVYDAIHDMPPSIRNQLMIKRLIKLPEGCYLAQTNPDLPQLSA